MLYVLTNRRCCQAFATLSTPEHIPFDPRPALSHVAQVAEEACRVTNDQTVGVISELSFFSHIAR